MEGLIRRSWWHCVLQRSGRPDGVFEHRGDGAAGIGGNWCWGWRSHLGYVSSFITPRMRLGKESGANGPSQECDYQAPSIPSRDLGAHSLDAVQAPRSQPLMDRKTACPCSFLGQCWLPPAHRSHSGSRARSPASSAPVGLGENDGPGSGSVGVEAPPGRAMANTGLADVPTRPAPQDRISPARLPPPPSLRRGRPPGTLAMLPRGVPQAPGDLIGPSTGCSWPVA